MSKKLFGKYSGRSHFPELANFNMSSFNHNSWFIEVDTTVKLEDLLDPATWGPQKLVRRGDLLHVMHASNEFFAVLICSRTAAGYPSWEILMAKQREAPAKSPAVVANGQPHIEFHPGRGFLAIRDGQIVGVADTQAEATALLEMEQSA